MITNKSKGDSKMYELLGRAKENRKNIMYVVDTTDLQVDAISERELIDFMKSDPSVIVSGFIRQANGRYRIESGVQDCTVRVLYKDEKLRYSIIEYVYKGLTLGSSIRKAEVLVKSRNNILHMPLFTCEEYVDHKYLTEVDISVSEISRSEFGLVFKLRTVDAPELCQIVVSYINIDLVQSKILYQGEDYSSLSEVAAATI